MTHNDAFLEAIRAEPESLELRLIYADWLEEQNDPRGAFIRAQCLAEMLPHHDPMRVVSEIESDAYLDAYRSDWTSILPGHIRPSVFRGGFIDSVMVSDSTYTENAARFRSAEPLRDVDMHFYSSQPRREKAFNPALLEGFTGVRWFGEYTEADLERLVDSPPESMTSLGLCGRTIGEGEPYSLRFFPRLPKLKALELSPTMDAINATQSFFDSAPLEQLETVVLNNVNYDEGDRPLLDTLANLGSLRTLRLNGCLLLSWDLGSFHRHEGWEKLTALHLRDANRGGNLFANLALAKSLTNLHTLEISRGRLSATDAKRFARAVCRGGLAKLSLPLCSLDDKACTSLLRNGDLHGLRSLDLSDNRRLTSQAIQALAESPALAGLIRLRLRNVPIGVEGTRALASSPYLRNLRELDLGNCGIGTAGVEALAGSRNLATLCRLNLNKNRIDSAGARALAKSPYLHKLMSLSLHRNRIDDAGAIALANSDGMWNLTTLGLKDNRIREGGLCKMLSLFQPKRLRRLQVRGNPIGKRGAERLYAWSCERGKQLA